MYIHVYVCVYIYVYTSVHKDIHVRLEPLKPYRILPVCTEKKLGPFEIARFSKYIHDFWNILDALHITVPRSRGDLQSLLVAYPPEPCVCKDTWAP